jgi:hypothetical protein
LVDERHGFVVRRRGRSFAVVARSASRIRRRRSSPSFAVVAHRRRRSPSPFFYSSRSFAVFFSTSSDGDGKRR